MNNSSGLAVAPPGCVPGRGGDKAMGMQSLELVETGETRLGKDNEAQVAPRPSFAETIG